MLNGNTLKYMANPRSFTLKKWLAELLKEKYPPHDHVADRVASSLITEKDLEDFGKLLTAVFEKGYFKAVEDYKSEFEKMGVKINIVAERPNPKNPD